MEFNNQTGSLAKWLAELPRGSIGKTAELLYKALQDIRRQEMHPDERFHIMETIREPVHYVTENMRSHFVTMTIPAPEKTILIINACRAFYDGMATSYQMIVRESSPATSQLMDSRMLVTAMHRALKYIGSGVLTAYEVYAASHQENWSKLHSIYRQAEHAGLESIPINDELADKNKKSSITDEYLRVLLLSLTSPYKLRQGEIAKVHNFLAALHDMVSLSRVSETDSASTMGMPMIDLTGDYPPELAGASHSFDKQENYRLINTIQLVDTLKEELNILRNPNNKTVSPTLAGQYDISADLLRRLIESWGFLKKRKFNRRQVFAKTRVSIGLYNTHQLLVQDLQQSQVTAGRPDKDDFNHITQYEIDIGDIKNINNDIWATVHPGYGHTNAQESVAQHTHGVDTEKANPDKQWTLLNQSAEGFCLMCTFNCGDKLQVGEIVSIRNEAAPTAKQWSVGIIKWLKSYGKSGIEIGGQLLAPYAIPVGITTAKDTNDTIPTRGLLLAGLSNLNRPSSIICFSRLYRVGDILRIKQLGQDEQKIQLTRMAGYNNIINQFLYSPVGQRGSTALENDESSIEIDIKKFKDVWNSI